MTKNELEEKTEVIGENLSNFSESRSAQAVWDALHRAEENGLLNETEWDNICTAMAWITEDLGVKNETIND